MRRNTPISEEVAHKIYDILVEITGIHVPEDMDTDRMSFVRYATEGSWTEFRFSYPLGFGGKVWNNAGRWYVGCYREDDTPEREAIIERTNAALAKLFKEVYG
jgi:hypothetical protein